MKKLRGLLLRKNRWWICASVNGRLVRKSLGIPKEQRKEAEKAVAEFWNQVGLGKLSIIDRNPLLKTLFDSYLQKLRPEVCEGHFEQVWRHLKSFQKELNYKCVSDINPAKVMDWLTAIPYRNKAQKIQTNLNAALGYAVSIGLIEKNPLEKLPRLKHQNKKREALTREQYIEFGKHIWNYSCCNLIFFLMRTGCRFSEAARLKWKDISLTEAKAIITAENNKTRKTKEIPLADDLAGLLSILKQNSKPGDYLFLTKGNKLFLKDNVRRAVKSIGEKIGRADFTTHAFRNTVITLSLNAKANLLDVQNVVGHSKASTTSRYDNGNFERKKEVVNSLPVISFPHLYLVS